MSGGAESLISSEGWQGAHGLQARLLRCLWCGSALAPNPGEGLTCTGCERGYPVVSGTVQALRRAPGDAEQGVRAKTAESFAYEWQHFGDLRPEWRQNFLDYMKPLDPEWLKGKLVLDLGTGSGRHAREAALSGAQVVAVDLGDAIHVARRNTPAEVMTVQADLEDLPLEPGSFDLVMSIGVLHHLPDTDAALRRAAEYVKPGGRLHVYLYWWPEVAWHRSVLRGVARVRRLTVRLPHHVLHALCYPLAAALFAAFVLPYRLLRGRPRARRLARLVPLKTYADYPFGVCVNDQFDRLSAPLERRFERDEVAALLRSAGLEDVEVRANHGWVGSGRRPAEA